MQVSPPIDLAAPPVDAAKTASGLAYKTLVASTGEPVSRTATALIQYTGWRQRTGATFFTTRGRGQPMAIAVEQVAPGIAEVLPAMHVGEKVVVWVPPSSSLPEPVVYEIELVGIVSPAVVGPAAGGGSPADTARSPPVGQLQPRRGRAARRNKRGVAGAGGLGSVARGRCPGPPTRSSTGGMRRQARSKSR